MFNRLDLLLRKLEAHSSLSEEDRQAVLALPYTVGTLEIHAYTIREGQRPDGCAILLSGFACRQKLTSLGARQIVALQIPGEALDFQHLFLDTADHNIHMLTRGDIAVVPREAIQMLVRSRSAIGRAILVAISIDASIYREWLVNVGGRDARLRFCHLLCEFATWMERQGLVMDRHYELPMTQEQIGDAIGLTAVHVNRTIKSLEADGLIVRKGRTISFPDRRRLEEIADFDPLYLNLKQQHAGQNP